VLVWCAYRRQLTFYFCLFAVAMNEVGWWWWWWWWRRLASLFVKLKKGPLTPWINAIVTFESKGTCQNSVYLWSTMICKYKSVQVESKLQHTGTQTTIAKLLHHLWYRPAVFFCHFCLTVLSLPYGRIQDMFKKCCFFNFLKITKGNICRKQRAVIL
jgi:hypothetical protein